MCARWKEFSEYLHVKRNIIDSVHQQCLGIVENCFLKVTDRWLAREEGTGDLPRTWDTVLDALRLTGYPLLVEDIKESLMKDR